MNLARFVLALAISFAACSTVTPEKMTSDKPLYEHASKLFAERSYEESLKFFESLRNRFPQSPYLIDTELKIAEARYRKDDFAEAEVEFQNFRTLHPTNPKIPYVTYMIGMSRFNRIPGGVDRDQTQTERAIDVFEELLQKYPAAPEATQAQTLLTKCQHDLAAREMYVANFYLKRHDYSAALLRLASVRTNPDFKDFAVEASYKLGYARYKLNDVTGAKEVLTPLVSDPNAGEYGNKARNLLKRIASR
ncbi:MAG: outer membrane protein assembly factor BamD [Pseudomonadota bacterium]